MIWGVNQDLLFQPILSLVIRFLAMPALNSVELSANRGLILTFHFVVFLDDSLVNIEKNQVFVSSFCRF